MARTLVILAAAVLALGCRERPTGTAGDGAGEGAGESAGHGAGASRGASAAATASGARGPALRATSNAGSFTAEVTPLASAIPMNEHFGVELALFRADGTTPYEPEAVTLDARMEEHEHGMLRHVELQRIGPGRWRADGLLFHMVGVWQFQIDVREGPRVERAQMDFVLE